LTAVHTEPGRGYGVKDASWDIKNRKDINPGDFEVEELVFYGLVKGRLIKAGLSYNTAYEPECIPPGQV
jgi:hypothetical protein